MRLADLPDDEAEDVLRELRDITARDNEFSAVDGDVRRKVSAIIDDEIDKHGAGAEGVIVERVTTELSPFELRGIVTDWLRLQMSM
jgi:hypothetical protein